MKKRIVKHPKIRRIEIINTAEKLFQKEGYDNTSVEAIIKKAGIAKGTFYHYFKTKQDILQASVDRIGEKMKHHFNEIAEHPKLNAIDKLKLMIQGKEKEAIVLSPVMKFIHKPQNRELQERLNIYAVIHIYPIIANVFEQGFKEGIFKNSLSVETVQMVFSGSQFILNSGLFHWSSKQQLNFLKAGQLMLEKIAGAKTGSFKFITKKE